MKRTIWPSASWISLSTAFSRSSNSPRYLEPASSAPMSSAITRRSRRHSGTSPATIRCARPSTIAVLPTPGSPISTGLFFGAAREDLDHAADLLVAADHRVELARSRPRRSGRARTSRAPGRCPRGWARSRDAGRAPRRSPASAILRSGSSSETPDVGLGQRQQDVLGRDVLVAEAGRLLLGLLQHPDEFARGRHVGDGVAAQLGQLADRLARPRRAASCASTPRRCRTGTTTPSSCSSRARSRWGGATSGFEFSEASRCAAATASWDLTREAVRLHLGSW